MTEKEEVSQLDSEGIAGMYVLSRQPQKNTEILEENELENKIISLPVIDAITRGLWKQLNYNSSSVNVEAANGEAKIDEQISSMSEKILDANVVNEKATHLKAQPQSHESQRISD